jgi:exodeoxyribonuclease VIII
MDQPIPTWVAGNDLPTGLYMMKEADYQSIDAINATALKAGQRSIAHLHAIRSEPRKDSPSLAFGRLAHLAILEPERFSAEVFCEPDFGDGRTKAAKEAKAEWHAWLATRSANPIIASMDDMHACTEMIRNAYGHGDLSSFLKDRSGVNEVTAIWTDRSTGLRCKARIDRWVPDRAIIDVKTSRDASPHGFSRSIANFRYHIQAAWYLRAIEQTAGETRPFLFAAIESEAPFAAALYEMDLADLRHASELIDRTLRMLADTQPTLGLWPSYQPDGKMQPICLPGWATSTESRQIEPLDPAADEIPF